MTPGRYDITIYQRATFTLDVTLPLNLTGHQVLAQIWDDRRRRKYVDFSVSILSTAAQSSTIRLTIASNTTRLITKQGEWDLMVIYPNNTKQYWLEGDVKVDPGYTDTTE